MSLDEFDRVLKEVVEAKRLSASKVNKLTEIAMKCMEDDTHLVSLLYRTHKTLPPAAKVSSLYVFDALCRAAKHQASKEGLVGDFNSSKGNCATFLLKIESVLDGLIQDMISAGLPEAKEKTKKILDFWAKGSTFPAPTISRLNGLLKEPNKESNVKPLDPRAAVSSQTSVPNATKSPSVVTDPQAALLALLTKAVVGAAQPSSQIVTNTDRLPPPLDASQLALLQHLTQTTKAGVDTSSQPPLSSIPYIRPASDDPRHRVAPSPPDNSAHNSETRFELHDPHDSTKYYDVHNDEPYARSNFRGGFRNRGRTHGDGWGRDGRYSRDRESPQRRIRRSRSRSPPTRHGGRRDVQPYSPPQRPSLASIPNGQEPTSVPGSSETDEFGREIRPSSAHEDVPLHEETSVEANVPAVPFPINHDQTLSSSIAADTSSAANSLLSGSDEPGLESFNITTFDFTSAAAWESLGKMWQVTNGQVPSTDQLMQFVMSIGTGAATQAPTINNQQSHVEGSLQPTRGYMRGRGRGRGYGQSHNHFQSHRHTSTDESEAIVLHDVAEQNNDAMRTPDDHNKVGRMQRVGDKWMFVRDTVGIT